MQPGGYEAFTGDYVVTYELRVEHDDGRWEVLTYAEFRRRLLDRAAERSIRRNGRRLGLRPAAA